jgi:tRNA(Arg) A34 adenosine deaminase TadA
VIRVLGSSCTYTTLEAQMRLAITLARENVLHRSGGPFGAAVFEEGSGRLVSVGVNSVERLHNAILHTEVMALMFAEAYVQSYTGSLVFPGGAKVR